VYRHSNGLGAILSYPFGGIPSDQVERILATGGSDVDIFFVSMSAGDPAGRDHEYLEWHTYDHRPEQHRIKSIRASLRLMSTPTLHDARIISLAPYDEVDHVMTYFFDDANGLAPFNELAQALREAGRMPLNLPPVDRNVFRVTTKASNRRLTIGADVLPWWPAESVYLLLERGFAPVDLLLEVDGVAGIWSGAAAPEHLPASLRTSTSQDSEGMQISYLFIDEDPLPVGEALRPVLDDRWTTTGAVPLLAAPFCSIHSRLDWERHSI
jgi:hypothetical protein